MKTRFRSERSRSCLTPNPAQAGFLFLLVAALSFAAFANDPDYPGWTDDTPPAGPFGEAVALGKRVLTHTPENAAAYTGNALNCTSCHLNAGRMPYSSPWVGVWGVFPEFRSRNARLNSMQDRINDCFERSMNGKALPRDSRAMRDIVAYLAFLSYGIPVGSLVEGQGLAKIDPLPGDTIRGREVFAGNCTLCHGADGQGTAAAPPLWGPHSYNIGAGMARVRTAAAFIKVAMPFDKPGTLTPQQAFDVAAYINSRPRPDFARKAEDWPNGDPPPDVAYPTHGSTRKGAR